MSEKIREVLLLHVLPPCLCFVCAMVLILLGARHGWGWLLFFGFLWSLR